VKVLADAGRTMWGQFGDGIAQAQPMPPANSAPHSCCEPLEQRLCLFQIGGGEALGEPAVDRRQKLARRSGLAVVAPQPGEAGGGGAIPTTSPLPKGLARAPADSKLPPDPERSGSVAGANRPSTDGLPAPM
jgi:hypothetical protein